VSVPIKNVAGNVPLASFDVTELRVSPFTPCAQDVGRNPPNVFGISLSHVLSALKEKRARLAGELCRAHLRVIAIKTDLASVDACLRIFGLEVDPKTIPAKTTLAKTPTGLPKGAGTRTALEILRETGEPMSSQELAASILQRFGKPIEACALTMIARTIHSNFCRRRDGIVEFDRSTYPGKWRLTGK
jgi:hypothetical protein